MENDSSFQTWSSPSPSLSRYHFALPERAAVRKKKWLCHVKEGFGYHRKPQKINKNLFPLSVIHLLLFFSFFFFFSNDGLYFTLSYFVNFLAVPIVNDRTYNARILPFQASMPSDTFRFNVFVPCFVDVFAVVIMIQASFVRIDTFAVRISVQMSNADGF